MPRPGTLEEGRFAGVEARMRRTDEGGARWLNFGDLESAPTHSINAPRQTTKDQRGGSLVTSGSFITDNEERFTLRTRNTNPDIFSLFLGAELPGSFAQTSTPVVDQSHTAKLGAEISLLDAAGARVFNLSSVVVTDSAGTTTYVLGTDYLLDAVKGVVTPLTAGSIVEDEELLISFTPAEMTDAPMILPQTMVEGVEVEVEFWEVADSGNDQLVRTIPRALVTSSGNRQLGVDQDNWIELELLVLADPASPTPAGRAVRVL